MSGFLSTRSTGSNEAYPTLPAGAGGSDPAVSQADDSAMRRPLIAGRPLRQKYRDPLAPGGADPSPGTGSAPASESAPQAGETPRPRAVSSDLSPVSGSQGTGDVSPAAAAAIPGGGLMMRRDRGEPSVAARRPTVRVVQHGTHPAGTPVVPSSPRVIVSPISRVQPASITPLAPRSPVVPSAPASPPSSAAAASLPLRTSPARPINGFTPNRATMFLTREFSSLRISTPSRVAPAAAPAPMSAPPTPAVSENGVGSHAENSAAEPVEDLDSAYHPAAQPVPASVEAPAVEAKAAAPEQPAPAAEVVAPAPAPAPPVTPAPLPPMAALILPKPAVTPAPVAIAPAPVAAEPAEPVVVAAMPVVEPAEEVAPVADPVADADEVEEPAFELAPVEEDLPAAAEAAAPVVEPVVAKAAPVVEPAPAVAAVVAPVEKPAAPVAPAAPVVPAPVAVKTPVARLPMAPAAAPVVVTPASVRAAAYQPAPAMTAPASSATVLAQVTFSFELLSLELTAGFRIAAIDAQPSTNTVSVLLGAESKGGVAPLAAAISFHVESSQTSADGKLQALTLVPLTNFVPPTEPSLRLETGATTLPVAQPGHSRGPIQIAAAGAAPHPVQVHASCRVVGMDFNPRFEVERLYLELASQTVFVQLDPTQEAFQGNRAPGFTIAIAGAATNHSPVVQLRLAPVA